MYLHLGEDTLLREDEIVGIFDLDTCTVTSRGRRFLDIAQKEGRVRVVTSDLPKSFVIASPRRRESGSVYITQMGSLTLRRRAEAQSRETRRADPGAILKNEAEYGE